MSDIFREVDEELKRDKALLLLRQYGKYAIAFAVAAVVMTAALVGWQNYRESQRESDGRSFATAMHHVAAKDTPAATAAFGKLAQSGGGYHVLALLQQAALKTKAGDVSGAAAIYDQLAGDSNVDRPFRDLATILSALVTFDKADPAILDKKLAPMSAEGAAFRPSALELRGLLAVKRGDFKTGRQYFQQLADDITAPGGLRQRATQILAWLGERGGV
ncbi:MAG: hypothetical protein QOK29_4139 [Rhodospirillaceae bacterium]|nr:hypothetical protein [Rhodospirillaceae bacterium]